MLISIYRKYLHYFERPCFHGMAMKAWRHERIILCICDQQVSFGQIMFSPAPQQNFSRTPMTLALQEKFQQLLVSRSISCKENGKLMHKRFHPFVKILFLNVRWIIFFKQKPFPFFLHLESSDRFRFSRFQKLNENKVMKKAMTLNFKKLSLQSEIQTYRLVCSFGGSSFFPYSCLTTSIFCSSFVAMLTL